MEYLAAMLSVERDNTDKVRRYFHEAKSLGIDVAAPDVNLSRWTLRSKTVATGR